ncbi:MAG: UDP-N-acetylglucosamine 2-epimerase (non-hydrolyzing) [Bacteroidales bacterium]|nr:UDP-N-acetylglucosamine 2-epimerase (non-hydrolyzing) [Bacteroidales bacterium]
MKVVSIVGARPQFVKAAVVSRQWKDYADVDEILVHTGQHFDDNMSELFFREMSIPQPKYNLGIHTMANQDMVALMMERLEPVLRAESPDWVVVFGDTNSTLAGAKTAKKLGTKLAHVEAGLRSFNHSMPEEYNRIHTDWLSDVLFCPTSTAVDNLKKEHLDTSKQKIILCGDVMYDAALFYAPSARKPQVDLTSDFVLATIHRAESVDNQQILQSIFDTLEQIAIHQQVIIPLHPRTKAKLSELSYPFHTSHITFIDPVGYFEMLYLLRHCSLVLTDSGGLQKEAYFFEKKCVTLRNETEWVELVENGVNLLAGTETEHILRCVRQMSSLTTNFPKSLYGDGRTACRITSALRDLM